MEKIVPSLKRYYVDNDGSNNIPGAETMLEILCPGCAYQRRKTGMPVQHAEEISRDEQPEYVCADCRGEVENPNAPVYEPEDFEQEDGVAD